MTRSEPARKMTELEVEVLASFDRIVAAVDRVADALLQVLEQMRRDAK